MSSPTSSQCRILLLDDEPLILMDLEFAAEDRDCEPLTATNVGEAMAHIEAAEAVTCAVLDVTLRDGETCVPVARELERRRIPYLLHSGDLNRQEGTLATLNAQLIAKPACSGRVVDTAIALSEKSAENIPADRAARADPWRACERKRAGRRRSLVCPAASHETCR